MFFTRTSGQIESQSAPDSMIYEYNLIFQHLGVM
jgi:hypothetical protein